MAYRHLDGESGSERLCQHEELRGFTDLVVLLIGWKFASTNQKHYHQKHLISMDLLLSFLRRHFAGKPVVASRNVICFLTLPTGNVNLFIIAFEVRERNP